MVMPINRREMLCHAGTGFGAMAVGVLALVGLSAYPIAYFGLCERFGSATFEIAPSSPNDMRVTWQGEPFLDRMYGNHSLATLFIPAAQLETWLTGVQVHSVDRSRIGVEFDFTIDDNFMTPPPDTSED